MRGGVAAETYTLDAYLGYGPSSTGDVALPFLWLAPASLPLPPLGTIGIDPSQVSSTQAKLSNVLHDVLQ